MALTCFNTSGIRVLGTTPLAMIALAARGRRSMSGKMATKVRTSWGRGSSRSQIFVMIPSVPSLPTMSGTQSYPGRSAAVPPLRRISRFGRTISILRGGLSVEPYRRAWGPPALVSTFPPIVEMRWLAGSGAKKSPISRAAALTATFGTPGSTTATRAVASIATMRRRRAVETTIAPAQAIVPPESPVPAPRGTIAVPASCAAFTTAATSAVLPGTATALGGWRSKPASYSQTRRSSARQKTLSSPQISWSCCTKVLAREGTAADKCLGRLALSLGAVNRTLNRCEVRVGELVDVALEREAPVLCRPPLDERKCVEHRHGGDRAVRIGGGVLRGL